MSNFLRKLIPYFLIDKYHFFLAFLSAFIYRFPSRKLIVVGITGTKAKSTVVEFCHRVLREAGFCVGSLSSIRFKLNDDEWSNLTKTTMPGRFQIQKFLRQAVDAHCQYVILEVTSEGILQHRHRFIDFKVAVFTNLSPEHIERHGSFENYRAAKGKLFQVAKKVHVLNLDDKNAEYFLQFHSEQKYKYSLKNIIGPNHQLPITNLIADSDGIRFEVGGVSFKLSLLGKFNIYNALAAICVGLSQDVSLEVCQKALEKIKGLPGRMEIVVRDQFTPPDSEHLAGFMVIVDQAHTPESLEAVYEFLRSNASSLVKEKGTGAQRLVCVFGSAGGGRDKWKRPKMGEVAARYCDEIVLSNEDPYDEDPDQILLDIKSGIPNDKIQMTNLISDRKEAIREALKKAKPGDVVVITGKGCEPWMTFSGGKKIAWDDREVVREEFEKLKVTRNQ